MVRAVKFPQRASRVWVAINVLKEARTGKLHMIAQDVKTLKEGVEVLERLQFAELGGSVKEPAISAIVS